MTKKLFLMAGFSALLLTMSCKKVQDLLTFKLSYTSKVSISPSNGINLPFDLFTPAITISLQPISAIFAAFAGDEDHGKQDTGDQYGKITMGIHGNPGVSGKVRQSAIDSGKIK